VLAYHRVRDPYEPGFDAYRPNVSASPAQFAAQLDYFQARFSIISLDDLLAWLQGTLESLPPRPLLITFDDGYRDNYQHAFPALRERNLPFVIFLTTDFLDTGQPFYWDVAAYLFHHSEETSIDLPDGQPAHWTSEHERDAVLEHWLAVMKALPDDQRALAVAALPRALHVDPPVAGWPAVEALTWDMVREMAEAGGAFGSHTCSHPIIARLSDLEARNQITKSSVRLTEELGKPTRSFAYPNGMTGDFLEVHFSMLREAGIEVAFTLEAAPSTYTEVRNQPLAIRRAVLGHHEDMSRVAFKVMGMKRLLKL
jgi:peptidoglycan/xylan/chitin deacetylase (PgdA/CDA1 family)